MGMYKRALIDTLENQRLIKMVDQQLQLICEEVLLNRYQAYVIDQRAWGFDCVSLEEYKEGKRIKT